MGWEEGEGLELGIDIISRQSAGFSLLRDTGNNRLTSARNLHLRMSTIRKKIVEGCYYATCCDCTAAVIATGTDN